jgi:hypothetical protein
MVTKIKGLYETLREKKTIVRLFIDELKGELLSQKKRKIRVKEVKGCSFLKTVSFHDLKETDNWYPFENTELTEPQKLLLDKIEYMENCGHSSFVDTVEMLRRIVNKGMKGLYGGRNPISVECLLDEEGESGYGNEGLNHDQFLRKTFVGHFHHNNGTIVLTEPDIKCIKRVLKRNGLL